MTDLVVLLGRAEHRHFLLQWTLRRNPFGRPTGDRLGSHALEREPTAVWVPKATIAGRNEGQRRLSVRLTSKWRSRVVAAAAA